MILFFLQKFTSNVCHVCRKSLIDLEKIICLDCELHFKNKTIQSLELQQLFWGRIQLEEVFSMNYYIHGAPINQLIHDLKYHKIRQNAEFLGLQLSKGILNDYPCRFDGIIPIPLHPKKRKKRTYNQAEEMAKIVSEHTNIPVLNSLSRVHNNTSQTKKSKYHRWSKSNKIFQYNGGLSDKGHYLILDDVITTGSTIEQASLTIQSSSNCRLSVASSAYTPLDYLLLNH